MRKFAIGAVLSGALAAAAVAVPSAHADTVVGDTKVSNVVVNGGKDVAVGTTNKVTFKVTFTASDPAGVTSGQTYLYHGTWSDPDAFWTQDSDADTTCTSGTTVTCTSTYTIVPEYDLHYNALAGTWHIGAYAKAKDGDSAKRTDVGTFHVQRYSKLTVNASPEPVAKGKAITVTGKLSRANWEDHLYHGYTGQPVKLQFRKAGSSTYSTVKTVNSDGSGNLKTTVTASADGYWRYYFAGTSTTPAAKATGDYLDVK
ncbi:calcium-binding protein [Streptomyces sp. NPDC005813]|uniref:calcium-binding protein n=1 Tax=Streptomyces sp. NPDC005813 TaxID=3155592 RepID=UPI0033EC5869